MLILRSAQPTDLKEMQQLFVDTISTVCTNDYTPEQIEVWASSVKNTQRWLDVFHKQLFLVAEKDNRIVGYGSLESGNYIDFLYIHRDYQRQGIAQKLFSALEDHAKKVGSKILTSDVSKTAQPFFEKNGFRIVSENKKQIEGIEMMNYKMMKPLLK